MVRLINHLTERDRRIALDCYEHRVLTTEQLRRLHFAGRRTASARLGQLHALRVLDRFRPAWQRGEGSTPFHWLLDEGGARIVAGELGVERTDLRWRHDAALGVAGSTKLAHQVAANDFFTALAEQARAAGGALTEWYGERATHDLLAGRVIPDGYGVLELPGRQPAHLLLELDRGTEPHGRLLDKARGYVQALPKSTLVDLQATVVFALPARDRADRAERAIGRIELSAVVIGWSPGRIHSTLTDLSSALARVS